MSKKPLTRHMAVICLLGAMAAACGSGSGPSATDDLSDNSGPRVKAPSFDLVDVNGKKLSLAGLKGKVVFMDFWATWCPPCRVSSPEVEKLYEEYKGHGLEVLSLSLDENENALRIFIADHQPKTRMVMVGASDISVRYRVSGIPAFFIIDQEGYLTASWTGYSPRLPKAWRKALDRLFRI